MAGGVLFRLATIALAAILIAGPSVAATIAVHSRATGQVLSIEGDIERGDVDRLRTAISRNPGAYEVQLASPGGQLFAGIEMGEIIRESGLATRVTAGASCSSACVYTFLGGALRWVDGGGRIGVHMATVAQNEDIRDAVLQAIAKGPVGYHVAVSIIEQMAAVAAASVAEHLVKMGVSLELMRPNIETDNWEMHWLTREEMRSMNVTNAF